MRYCLRLALTSFVLTTCFVDTSNMLLFMSTACSYYISQYPSDELHGVTSASFKETSSVPRASNSGAGACDGSESCFCPSPSCTSAPCFTIHVWIAPNRGKRRFALKEKKRGGLHWTGAHGVGAHMPPRRDSSNPGYVCSMRGTITTSVSK